MNAATAKIILAQPDRDWLFDWPKIMAELGAEDLAGAMDRVRWIANGGTLGSYPKEQQDAKAAKLTQDAPEGKSTPAAVQEAGSAAAANVESGNGIADAESIRREVAKAVLPLVAGLETMLSAFWQFTIDPEEHNAARKLCREAREKWGTP